MKVSAVVDCHLLVLVGSDCGDLLSFERVSNSASAQGYLPARLIPEILYRFHAPLAYGCASPEDSPKSADTSLHAPFDEELGNFPFSLHRMQLSRKHI